MNVKWKKSWKYEFQKINETMECKNQMDKLDKTIRSKMFNKIAREMTLKISAWVQLTNSALGSLEGVTILNTFFK